jgi:PAS domain S-box-containing protein
MISDRTLYEKTPALLQAIDAAGHIVAVSDRWLTWLGYLRADVIGQPWQPFLMPASRPPWSANLVAECRSTGRVQDRLLQFQHRHGHGLTVQFAAQLVSDETGVAQHCLVVLNEVAGDWQRPNTEPEPAERVQEGSDRIGASESGLGVDGPLAERLGTQASLKRYARMVEAAQDGICLLDRDFRYQFANQVYRDWYGNGDLPIVGQTVSEVLGPAAAKRLAPLFERCLNGETIRYGNWFEFPKLGKRFRSVTLAPYVEEDGDITGMVTSIRDLTTLKEIEIQQQQLLEMIEATPDFIWTASPQGEIVYLNPALRDFTNPRLGQQARPTHMQQFHPAWAVAKVMEEAIPVAINQGTWQGETALLDPGGQEIPISQTVTAHLDERGEVKLLSTIARDIRSQKALECELRDRLELETLLSRISAEFVNLPTGALVSGITQALQAIAEVTQAGRSYVYLLSKEQPYAYLLSEWHTPDVAPIADEWHTVRADAFPWWQSQLHDHQLIVMRDPAHLPPEAVNERRVTAALAIGSLAVVPMSHQGQFIGYIGLAAMQPKAWSNHEIALLRLVANLFANANQRHQAETALRESEARFQRLATNMPGVIYRYHQCPDGTTYFSYVSPGSRLLWELEPEAIYADVSVVWNLVHPDDVEAFGRSITTAIADNQPWFHEHRIITPSGQLKWLQGVAKAERQADGRYDWDGMLIDVTARRQAESALQESEARFQRLAATMPGIIYRLHRDINHRESLTYVSPTCREIWEVEPEVILQDTQAMWQLVHPADRDRLHRALLDSQWQLTPLFEDYRILTPSGQLKWLQMVARPCREPDGSCLWDGIVIDISEQRATQAALQATEALNQAILSALPDLLLRVRRDGLCLDMQYPSNFKVVRPREHQVGRYIQDVLSPKAAQERIWAIEQALSTGEIQIYEYEMEIHGENCWEEARIMPISADEVLVLVRDIDDRKRTEAALRQSEALNRAIVNALPDRLIRMTRAGQCLTAQHPNHWPTGVPGPAAIGHPMQDQLPPNLVKQHLTHVQRALDTRQTQVYEYPVQRAEHLHWEESRVVPLTDNEVLILVRDIDERHRAEEEVRRLNRVLESQKQRLEELVERRTAELLTFMNALPDQIFVVDRATNRLTFGNDVVLQFAEKELRQDFVGKTVFECFVPEQAAHYHAQNCQVFESGDILHVEEAMNTAEGIVYLDTYKIPLKQANGEVYALIGTSRDITELVKVRQILEAQARQLEITNQELQSFSYSVSHDLRAPLRHINGFIAALKQHLAPVLANLDPKVPHYMEVIETSNQKMSLLIDGLLTLSRVGRQDMVMRSVPLGPLVEQAIALIEDFPPKAPDRLRIQVAPLPTVRGDATLLQQVFTNLIGNAVKFSRDRAPAVIQIGQCADGAIFVRDNGVGFDMAYADKLFSPLSAATPSSRFRRHRHWLSDRQSHHSPSWRPHLG